MSKFIAAFTAILLLTRTSQAQEPLQAMAKLDTTHTTARRVIEKLKTVEELHLSYNEKTLNLDKEIILPPGNVTVKELLDILADELNMAYDYHGKQIILKAANQANYTVSGYVTARSSGEALIGATIQKDGTTRGTVTNLYGYYALTLPAGEHTLVFTYVGYEKVTHAISLNKDMTLSMELGETASQLNEVVITGDRPDDNVAENQMSYTKIEAKKIKQIPALFGESDPLKVVKLLPGVAMTSETSSSYSVRGGGHDQNLILLDEAVVYNPSHLIGIFSTFNSDALKGMEFYKGNLPARYGGRLSSLLDVRMKEGNNKRFTGMGGISPIAARLTLEAPTIKDKGSLVLSGRRTYMDVFTMLSNDEVARSATMYFYDFNAKTNLDLDEKNKIYLSAYLGRDKFGLDADGFSPNFEWGNFTATLRWNRIYGRKLFSNLSLIYSKYDYRFAFGFEDFQMDWKARMNDYNLKIDFDYFMSPQHTMIFGLSSTLHLFNPGKMKLRAESVDTSVEALNSRGLEHAAYVGLESKFAGGKLLINPGLRLSAFQNLGAYTLFDFDENYEVSDTTRYDNGEIFNTFINLEPRLALTYRFSGSASLKAGYARSIQYLHLASNSIAGAPLDVWVPSTPNVAPQRSDQYSIGLFQNLFDNKLESSVEVYYKMMNSQIDFKDHANILLNRKLEGEFRFGEGRAYGVEFMLSKPEGRLNGWISYTFSTSKRTIEGVNNSKTYLSPYDRPHNLSVVATYQISERVDLSANWVYFTGSPFTAPAGKYYYQDTMIPVYSQRNGDRMPDYKRLDLSLTLKGKQREDQWLHSSWNFSVYNALNRKNPSFINFIQNEDNPEKTEAVMYYLLPIIPTVSWNFNF